MLGSEGLMGVMGVTCLMDVEGPCVCPWLSEERYCYCYCVTASGKLGRCPKTFLTSLETQALSQDTVAVDWSGLS